MAFLVFMYLLLVFFFFFSQQPEFLNYLVPTTEIPYKHTLTPAGLLGCQMLLGVFSKFSHPRVIGLGPNTFL